MELAVEDRGRQLALGPRARAEIEQEDHYADFLATKRFLMDDDEAQVAELGGDDHGGLGLEAAETAEAFDHGFLAGGEGEGLDAAVELVPTLELVLEEGEVLGEHHVIFIGKGVSR